MSATGQQHAPLCIIGSAMWTPRQQKRYNSMACHARCSGIVQVQCSVRCMLQSALLADAGTELPAATESALIIEAVIDVAKLQSHS